MTGKFGLAVQNINRVLSREHSVQSKTSFLQHKKQHYTWTWSTEGGNGNPLQYFGHRTSFLVLVPGGLLGFHGTDQLQLLWH